MKKSIAEQDHHMGDEEEVEMLEQLAEQICEYARNTGEWEQGLRDFTRLAAYLVRGQAQQIAMLEDISADMMRSIKELSK